MALAVLVPSCAYTCAPPAAAAAPPPLPSAAPLPPPLGKEIPSVGIEAASVAAGLDARVGVALADATDKHKPRSLPELPVLAIDLLDPAKIAKKLKICSKFSGKLKQTIL